MLSSEANVIMWDEMLSSGANVITWDQMLSCGKQEKVRNNKIGGCYHPIFYHLVLSCDVILWEDNTGTFHFKKVILRKDNTSLFIIPENFTHALL